MMTINPKNYFFLLLLAISFISSTLLGLSVTNQPQTDPSALSAQTWKVITEQNNNQAVTVSIGQKLFIPFQVENCDANHGDMYYKIEGPAVLQEELKGSMHSNASDYNGNNFFLFQPIAQGQTKLIFYRGKGFFWPTLKLAEFTIIVE